MAIPRVLAWSWLKSSGNTFVRYSLKKLPSGMDRLQKVLLNAKEIGKTVNTLKSEINEMEAGLLDNVLIERLEKENRQLEKQVENYKAELIRLEEKNERTEVTMSIVNNGSVRCEAKTEEGRVPKKEAKSVEIQEAKVEKPKENAKKNKKEGKKLEKVEPKKEDDLPADIGRLNMKVGKILQVEKHPDADSLYVEKVDIGGPQPITVVSGLVKYVSQTELEGRLVIILTNLKPAKMRGVTSEGMVMCASTEGQVEVLSPPSTSLPGDPILCEGYPSHPDPVLNPKKKIFETVAPDLKTDGDLYATYKGTRWTVAGKGFVTAATLKGVNIK